MTAASGRLRASEWRRRIVESGLRAAHVWVPADFEADIQAYAYALRHEKGVLLPEERKAEERAVASIEELPPATADRLIAAVTPAIWHRQQSALGEGFTARLDPSYQAANPPGRT